MKKIVIIGSGFAGVYVAKQLLKKAGTIKSKVSAPKYEYLVTGSVGQFETLGSRLLGKAIARAKHVII